MTKQYIEHRVLLSACFAIGLSGCGGSPTSSSANAPVTPATPPPISQPEPVANDGQGQPAPTSGARAGQIYNVTIPNPFTGEGDIAATVFEPSTMTAGETYPLVLYASGFGGTRTDSAVAMDAQAVAFINLADVNQFTAAGYGVMTFDHRGHGETGGKIRVMDPDFEGPMVVRVVDWAEANLDWLAYGPSVDGSDPNNLKLGAIGASYGGGYQSMLLAVDPKKRLDAIAPLLTWNDLRYSLAPNDSLKDAWINTLADGKDDVFDPFVTAQLDKIFAENKPNDEIKDFLRYHGIGYFCDLDSVMTNGGPGTAPLRASTPPPVVNAMFVQSSRDTLFNFNEALDSYNCFKNNGKDVRLLTVQIGHNTLGSLSNAGLATAPTDNTVPLLHPNDPFSLSATCAGQNINQATIAFFDEHVKLDGSDSSIPKPICLDLGPDDSILVDDVLIGGTEHTIPATTINVGVDESTTTGLVTLTALPLATPEVIAGIPRLNVTITDANDPSNTDTENTIIYVALGRQHAGQWVPIDNQLTPLRGLGQHNIEMTGVLERIPSSGQFGVMFYGANENHFATTGSKGGHATQVTIQGTIEIPQLGAPLPDMI